MNLNTKRMFRLVLGLFSMYLTSYGSTAMANGWTKGISEEAHRNEAYCSHTGGGVAVQAACSGRYCDDNYLRCESVEFFGNTYNPAGTWRSSTKYFSEENYPRGGECPLESGVVGMRGSGRYSDNLQVHCGDVGLPIILPTTGHYVKEWKGAFYSEEYDNWSEYFGPNAFISGFRCKGRYCDNMQALVTSVELVQN